MFFFFIDARDHASEWQQQRERWELSTTLFSISLGIRLISLNVFFQCLWFILIHSVLQILPKKVVREVHIWWIYKNLTIPDLMVAWYVHGTVQMPKSAYFICWHPHSYGNGLHHWTPGLFSICSLIPWQNSTRSLLFASFCFWRI